MTLPTSAKPTSTKTATGVNQTLTGTAGADKLVSAGSYATGGDTLIGGANDDTYYVDSDLDSVVEQAGGGIDTVDAFGSYHLADNVENLVLRSTGPLEGFGNGLANLIIGNTGSNLIDGGGGNDVLTGNGGNDMFVASAGTDMITDFNAGDTVILENYSRFTTFAQVRAALSQAGKDAVLDLGGGNSITFQNTSAKTLTAEDFILPLASQDLQLTFDDEFNTLSLYSGKTGSGTWLPRYPYTGLAAHTTVGHHDQQYYTDPTDTGLTDSPLGLNPFSVSNGVLDIHAQSVDAATSAKIYGYKYTSGLISSYSSFSQTYGYFEMRAELPAGTGLHPAFWLLPLDYTWPPELDVMEQRGQDPSQTTGTVHTNVGGTHTASSGLFDVGDSSTGFHTYGVDWEPDYLTWYVDGKAVNRVATPSDLNTPMYMLVNLAVGGTWAGNPGAGSIPADMKVDYVRAYASDNTVEDGSVISTGTSGSDTLYGSSTGDSLSGGSGNDSLFAGAGDDTLTGGSGNDTLYGGTGDDTYIVNAAGDTILEYPGEGTDTIRTSLSVYPLPNNTENLVYTGTGSFTGSGSTTDNLIDARTSNSATLNGLDGNDTLFGGAGADTIYTGGGGDLVSAGNGNDLVRGNDGDDTVNGGSGNDNLYGDAGDDLLDGSYGNDLIRGGTGTNTLKGGSGSGADTFGGDTVQGVDYINGGGGTDTYLVTGAYDDPVGVDLTAGTVTGGYRSGSTLYAIENVTVYTGTTPTTITGNWANNVLTGGNGDDVLSGMGGNDTLSAGQGSDTLDGGGGVDTLFGGNGADTFVFHRAEANGDTVGDFSNWDGDKIKLVGYGAGATFSEVGHDASSWTVQTADKSFSETIRFTNGPQINASAVQFS